MPLIDLFVMLIAILVTPVIIGWIQNRPVEAKFGMMDLLIPLRDPRDRMLSFIASFILPVALGLIVSIFVANRLIVSAFGVGIGALLSVSSAFFRPETLAPTIRNKLFAARVVYGSFVLTYVSLAALGSFIFDATKSLLQNVAIREGIIAGCISTIILTCVVGLIKLIYSKYFTPVNESLTIINDDHLRRLVREVLEEQTNKDTIS